MITLEEKQRLEAIERAKGCPVCKGPVDAFFCFNAALGDHVLRRCMACRKMFDEDGNAQHEVKA